MIGLSDKKSYTVIPERETVHENARTDIEGSTDINTNNRNTHENTYDGTDSGTEGNTYVLWTCLNLFRAILILLITMGFIHLIYNKYKKPLKIHITESDVNISMQLCVPGKFGDIYSQLPLTTWQPPGKDFNLPLYTTHNLNEIGLKKVHSVIIVQHGNLRNANDYFCGAVNSLIESNISPELFSSTLIIAPYFPIISDVCWDLSTNIPQIITDTINCGYPIWSNEGWKDGHSSISPGVGSPIYSYDAFNILITHFGNIDNFPSLRNITVFGFSAGAQTVLRYAALPNYEISNLHIKPRFIISDPSTYFYLDNKRPLKYIDVDGFTQITFSVPNSSWITMQWKVSGNTIKMINIQYPLSAFIFYLALFLM